jgi:hypothetical protein
MENHVIVDEMVPKLEEILPKLDELKVPLDSQPISYADLGPLNVMNQYLALGRKLNFGLSNQIFWIRRLSESTL